MPWKLVKLSIDEVAHGIHHQLKNEFDEVFVASGSPKNAAMLSGTAEAGQCLYYFSPDASTIFDAGLIKWIASTCEPPDPAHVRLLVGHADALAGIGPVSGQGSPRPPGADPRA